MLPDVGYWYHGGIQIEPPLRYEHVSLRDNARLSETQVEKLLYQVEVVKNEKGTADKDIVLIGPDGSGKTTIGLALIKEFGDQGKSALYLPAYEFISAMAEEGWAAGSEIISNLSSFDFVFVDDFGAPLGNGLDRGIASMAYFRLVDARYSLCKATGYSITEEMSELIDSNNGITARTADRIRGIEIQLSKKVRKLGVV